MLLVDGVTMGSLPIIAVEAWVRWLSRERLSGVLAEQKGVAVSWAPTV